MSSSAGCAGREGEDAVAAKANGKDDCDSSKISKFNLGGLGAEGMLAEGSAGAALPFAARGPKS